MKDTEINLPEADNEPTTDSEETWAKTPEDRELLKKVVERVDELFSGINMYLIFNEDGSMVTTDEISEDDRLACAIGVVDIVHLDPENLTRFDGVQWVRVERRDV